ncbi:MAG TPA: hypothetical protein VFM90_03865 [Cyclobacteriaceae bacterium]|nr:hypothetical protein [Cyclobacteriaceae bacterium]
MFAPFETLDDSARIWIYQATRKFTETEKSTISDALTTFTHAWVAHGNPLKTSFTILYDQFIVLAADENFNEASGCSIDSSVRVIRQLDEQFSLGLFDRTKIGFFNDGQTELIPLNALLQALAEGRWKPDSLFFNNVLSTKGQLKTGWIVRADQTWLKRYLAKTVV